MKGKAGEVPRMMLRTLAWVPGHCPVMAVSFTERMVGERWVMGEGCAFSVGYVEREVLRCI